MKTRILSLLAVGALASSGLMAQAIDTAPAQASVTASASTSTAPQYSGRINEVVALTQSGVDQSVVLSYINTSPGPFQPSADEIIRLRDAGISSQVITAMMQRGAQMRDQAQAVAAAAPAQNYPQYAQSSATYAQPTPAPQPAYVDPTYYPNYDYAPASSVVYVGGGYSYPYCYPSYYSGYYGPSFNFRFGSPFFRTGFGGFRPGFGGGFRPGFGGGFHGGFGGGFHGGGGGFHGGGGGFHGGGHR